MLCSALAFVSRSLQRPKDALTETQGKEPRSAPIFKLNADLLHLIFRMCTDLDEGAGENALGGSKEYRAMVTVRHCSQVCRFWRHSILSAPSIWGRILDLQQLDQENDLWREEVIRRTGDAFLHITGIVRGFNHISKQFFYNLIINHWGRVRVMDVDVYHPHVFKPETWNFLIRPSPFLQSLKLRFHPRTISPTSILPHGSIFANDAPSLRQFCVEQLLFDTRISWFSQLRRFGIFPSPRQPVTVCEIFEMLAQMPLLESLTIGDVRNDVASGELNFEHSSIELPSLQEIVFTDVEMKVCTDILQRISPAPTCALDIFCKQRMQHGVGSSNNTEDNLGRAIFIRYFKAFFDNHLISTLTLRQWNGVYTLESDVPKPKFQKASVLHHRRFRVSIDHHNPSIVFDIFGACQYRNAKTLKVILDVTKPSPIHAPYMAQFIKSLGHVETVVVNRPALRFLQDISKDISVIFPSMRTFDVQRTPLSMLPYVTDFQSDSDGLAVSEALPHDYVRLLNDKRSGFVLGVVIFVICSILSYSL
ncbi:hypothetical protein JR316_0011924 [Psilocybe cubensis]|uniref:Uncharacterized protein n=2 Tax=Psilocybe cubensis TaxID=181762 RepID=A0ACB8GL74_PSICU|nr:hypothetical protein JR316_0011924 [Psilocybe cubensis]KAH9476349.1 hypothetical protein JR316_0011924 [Psilocybe cubensis]